MAKKTALKRYAGVYYTESTVKKWRERPDRCYWVAFKESRTNKLRWERCGWVSEGWTPEAAQRRRYELLEQDRAGDYKPKQERKADQLTFGDLMEKHYLPWAEENKKHAYDDRSRYSTWLKDRFSDKLLNELSPLDIERVKKDMRGESKSDATIKHVLCLVRQAFNKASQWRLWNGPNPCEAVAFPKPNNARQRFLSQEQAQILLKKLFTHSSQVANIAIMSLYGGLRLSEIFGIKWSNVDLINDIITIQDTKNRESRAIFITEPIREVVHSLTPGEPDEPLFKTKAGKSVQWLSKTFRAVVEELKFNEGILDPRERVCFHTLRHTYASWAVMAGVPLYVVGKALGHKTLLMTQRYAHLAPDSHRVVFDVVAKNHNKPEAKDRSTLMGDIDQGST